MVRANKRDILNIGSVLNDSTRPLKERFRALFTLRNIGGATAIDQIHACFKDQSALLKHELAYCLGQMKDPAAISILTSVLEDLSQEPMVRHEAGEALGAIGEPTVIPLLEKYSKDPVPEVAETCDLALSRLRWLESNSNADGSQNNPYMTIDPAPAAEITDVRVLRKILLDQSETLFNRYRAMFSLRNLNTLESILTLVEGLKTGSALFKHEVAFVLGQLQEEASVPGLRASLENTDENEMVRHECAEALGSIATPECYEILNKYLNDSKRVVRESCIIALDMCEYENSAEFQYADTLAKLPCTA
ncbi:deoxyhypusine hydroxylase [Odontomachus brunneus]|uniref:deoxyhypusine hydroxylase n=1 Tax=Odontomachus brunneus TaxID=486640 RepID=UPI0013F1ABA8|nr:deoxyhypusine hydroxylase [Odontomachus brunneus]XP_032682173.1 deoxyhypusine hydroxylase [Odontomachus brunneus]XP_032682174.1 deoxyhypusine hydroxylase [Odontomachus brunneus]XP_032682175.1 deoxyhypusine hydroxylase [Odontomachus brunneus]